MPHSHLHRGFESADDAARLELEAEVAAGLVGVAIERCRAALDGVEVRRIVDLGSGPGVAAGALVRAFPSATVVAVDSSAAMLERAAARGVETVRLDLDGDLSSLRPCELVWASMALHHATDDVATVARFASLIAPGGLLCLLEHAAPTTVRLPHDDLGRPGLWDRLDAARVDRSGDPTRYPNALRAAGLDVLVDTTLTDTPEASPAIAAFAADRLRREGHDLPDEDREALAGVTDATGAEVRISRRLLLARRPT